MKLPELPEADLESYLEIEAERNFPYAPNALLLARSNFHTPNGDAYATLIAVPRNHVTRLETALRAAQLRPMSFSLGVSALQPPDAESSDGIIALVPGENTISLQSVKKSTSVFKVYQKDMEIYKPLIAVFSLDFWHLLLLINSFAHAPLLW